MSPTPQPSEPTGDDPLFRDYLLDLLDVGAAVAKSIKRQAEAEPTQPEPRSDLAEQFERVSRAMRRTILLARHIAQPANRPPSPQRTHARKRIIREVEDAIQRRVKDPIEAEPLHAEFRERLDAPDLDEDVANRPIADIITDIRRDLGIAHMPGTHPWERRTPRDLATLNERAAAAAPPGPYTPAPHGPDLDPPGKPKRRPHPPDPHSPEDHQELIALAKLLSGS